MSETDSSQNFMRTLISNVFDRALRGEYTYDADLHSLHRYRHMAREMNDPTSEARALNAIGVLHGVAGHSQAAIDTFQDVYALYIKMENWLGAVIALTNIAYTYEYLGELQEVLAVYDRAQALQEQRTTDVSSRAIIMTGRQRALLLLGRLEEADAISTQLLAITDEFFRDGKRHYVSNMTKAYRSMAEIALRQGQLEQAQSRANLALEFALPSGRNVELGLVYMTLAHIALQTGDEVAADHQFALADAAFAKAQAPAMTARAYLEEARYCKQHGDGPRTRYFGEKALAIFRAQQMAEDVALAEQLLA